MARRPAKQRARPAKQRARPAERRSEGPAEAGMAPRQMRRELLRWYSGNQRKLPWRVAEGTPDPYAVWVSEIMLQQTRAEVVSGYFRRWMERFPTPFDLAAADEQDVLSLWQGLGYYSRAKRLHRAARHLVEHHAGRLPDTVEGLLEIPGIGPYSAGAIASIAFGRRAPLVDGNVVRVLTRVFALPGDPQRAPLKKELWRIAAELAEGPEPGQLNQALMELGATVCTPKNPACYRCPLRHGCLAHLRGQVDEFPHKPPKKKPTPLSMRVALIVHRGRVLVEQRPSDARWWADLWTFPFLEAPAAAPEGRAGRPSRNELHRQERAGLEAGGRVDARALVELVGLPEATRAHAEVERLPVITHTVTRYRIELTPYRVRLSPGSKNNARAVVGEVPQRRWRRPSELSALPMPAPHRRLALAHFGLVED